LYATQVRERSTQTIRNFTGRQLTPTKYLAHEEENQTPWKTCTTVRSPYNSDKLAYKTLFKDGSMSQVLVSTTASYLFAFHWLMRRAFLFLVEGERCFLFWAWLVAIPVLSIKVSRITGILKWVVLQVYSDLDLTSGYIFTVSRNQIKSTNGFTCRTGSTSTTRRDRRKLNLHLIKYIYTLTKIIIIIIILFLLLLFYYFIQFSA
jgi:hypothetical protein